MKKIISVFLAVLMFTTMFPLSAFAQEQQEKITETEQEINYKSSNALGDVVANAMNESETKKEFNNNCYIQSVEISELSANVILSAQDESTVVVAIYDEESNIMVTSGKADVDSTSETVTVELSECEMPEYFVIKAFLLNSENEPLCTNYENRENTKAFIEFFEKTVFDFDEEKVINLDYGYETNFAVVADDAKVVEQSESENILTTNDFDNGIYVFENANEEIKSLKENDVLYYIYGEGADDYILTKVGTIKNNNGTVTITTAEEYEISDFFSYIKIDSTQRQTEQPQTFAMARGFDDESGDESGYSETFSISVGDEYHDGDATVSFSGLFAIKFYLAFYYDFKLFGEDYYEIEQSAELSFTGSATISASKEIKIEPLVLFQGGVPIYAGLEAEVLFSLQINLKAELKLEGSIKIEMKNGSRKVAGRKDEDLSENPEITLDANASGSLSLEVKPIASVGIRILKVIKAEIAVDSALIISGTITLFEKSSENTDIDNPDEKHDCNICIDGDIVLKPEVYIEVSFGINNKNRKTVLKINLYTAEFKLCDFYISIRDHKNTGFSYPVFNVGECPHIIYKVTFLAVDKNEEPLENVKIYDGTNTIYTDSNGEAILYYSQNSYQFTAELDGYVIDKEEIFTYPIMFAVFNGPKIVKINMEPGSAENLPDIPPNIENPNTNNTSGEMANGICGDDLTWTLYNDGEIIIRGEGSMSNYSSVGRVPWSDYSSLIKKATILHGVTSIGKNAFCYATNLTSITIPDSIKSIESKAFSNCTSLENAEIPDSVVNIYSDAFYSCTELSMLTIGKGVESIGEYAFWGCDNLEKITVAKENTNYSSDEYGALFDKDQTSILKYPGKSETREYKIPNGVKTIEEYAFSNSTNIKSICIPDSVETIGKAAFRKCIGLTNIVIPDSVILIDESAFEGCTGLTNVSIGSSVKSIEFSAFNECTALLHITIPTNVEYIGDHSFRNCTSLISAEILGNLNEINSYAFSECTSLKSVIISKSVKIIFYAAFAECKELENIYYTGTLAEWNNIIINPGFNNYFSEATVFCNYTSVASTTVISENYLSSKTFSLERTAGKSEIIDNATIGNDYLIIIVKDENAEDLLAPENLLSIDQQTAESEELIFGFNLDDSVTDYSVLFYNAYLGTTEEAHTHDYTSVVTAPTCAEKGYTTYTCSCGDSYIDDYVAVAEHQYSARKRNDPTCTEDGFVEYCCDICENDKYTEVIPAINHTPGDWEIITPAEIGVEGLEQQKCTLCGEVLDKRAIPALEDTAPALLGDVNGDGEITASDARLVLRFSAELDVPTAEQAKISDVNGDGTITASDARKILRISAELE